jgi:hypothetical protein
MCARMHAVFGDQFFGKADYTLYARRLARAASVGALAVADRKLVEKVAKLRPLQQDFERLQAEIERVTGAMDASHEELDVMLEKRRDLYGKLVGAKKALAHKGDAEGRDGGGLFQGLFSGLGKR